MCCEIRMRGKGKYTVKITCDSCKKPIVKWQEGVIYWDPRYGRAATLYVHVGKCEESCTKHRAFVYWESLEEHFAEYKVRSLRQGLKDVQKIRSKD